MPDVEDDQGLLEELAEIMKEEANEGDDIKNKPQTSYLFGNAAQRPSLFNGAKPSTFGKTGTSTLGSG
jgi:hypothetical protein